MNNYHYLSAIDMYKKLKQLLEMGVKFSDNIRDPYFCIYAKSRILSIKIYNTWFVNLDNWLIGDKSILEKLRIKSITPGSLAMKELKKSLKEHNVNYKQMWPALSPEINRVIKSGYNSGLLYAKPGFYNQEVYHYDINSAYAEAFKEAEIPIGPPSVKKGFSKPQRGMFKIYVMDMSVEYNSRTIFPYLVNSGDINKQPSQIIDNTGFQSMYKVITQIEYMDLIKDYKVYHNTLYTITFLSRKGIFDPFIDKFFKLKNETEGDERTIYKTVLASLAGKFSQAIDESQIPMSINEFGNVDYKIIKKGKDDIMYIHPAISLAVVDHVRKKLRDTVKKVGYENVLLTDTDGFISKVKIDLPISRDGLGEWKYVKYSNIIVNGTRSYFYTENGEFHSSISGLGDIYDDGINKLDYETLRRVRKLKDVIPISKEILFNGKKKYVSMNVTLGGDV